MTERSLLAELVDRADVIFHLAATVGVFNIIESPVATIMNNIGGTEAVLKMAAKKKKKVIVASTSEVYGKSASIPIPRGWRPGTRSRPASRAGVMPQARRWMNFWHWHIGVNSGFPQSWYVSSIPIGPRQLGRYGMVVPRFVKQALSGQNLTVYGTGRQSRCFTMYPT